MSFFMVCVDFDGEVAYIMGIQMNDCSYVQK
jgi:hypothetical protein